MNTIDRSRLPALAGLMLALMLIIAFVLDFVIIGTTSGEPVLSLENIGADLLRAQASRIWPVEAWLYVLMIVPFTVFVVGLYRALSAQGEAGLPLIGVTALMVFWVFSTVHNAAIVTVLQTLAPRYVAAAASGPGLEAAARALLGFGNTFFIPGGGVGTLLQVIGMASLGQATVQTARLPRWTGRVALACALLSLLGYLQYLVKPLLVIGLVGHLLYMLWQAAVSFQLLRQPAPAASAPRPAGLHPGVS